MGSGQVILEQLFHQVFLQKCIGARDKQQYNNFVLHGETFH